MQSFRDLSTRGKLLCAFGLMTLFAGTIVVFAYYGLSQVRDAGRRVVDVQMANVADLKDLRADHQAIRAAVALLMLTPAAEQATLRAEIEAAERRIRADLERIAGRRGGEGWAGLVREFESVQNASIQLRQTQQLPLLARGQVEQAKDLALGVQLERDRQLGRLADELVDRASRNAQASVDEADRVAAQTIGWLLALAFVALLTAIGMTVLLASSLAQPLQLLSRAAGRIGTGDLTVELQEDERRDETGVLQRAFRTMVLRLRQVMQELAEGIGVLASSASQITASTAQLAASAAESASAIAQTSATAEEVKQTTKVAADKAAQVQETAQRTVQVSRDGIRAMEESSRSMHEIRQQMDSVSQSVLRLADQGMAIGEIIGTVDDIADQSNLLSVNAAIEAARAGEEGAGFRVVAQEIRSLADQSKQATVQVRALLGDIQKATATAVMGMEQTGKSVQAGVHLADNAATSIRTLAAAIVESAQAAAQIAASAQQQAVGMDQVAYAMQSISEATAQNVAATRQTEAAAQSLQTLGLRLQGLVESYRR